MKHLLLASLITVVSACSGPQDFEQVPVEGLPCAGAGQQLKQPIVMEATHSDGTLRMTHAGGWSDGRKITASLRKGAETTLQIRFGVCRDPQCRDQTWVGGTQTVTVDTRNDNATLVVGVPGDHACR